MKTLRLIGWIVVGLGIAAALALVLGVAVMLLWNWLMPELFGLPEIRYWQAVGLLLLSHLLLRGPAFGHRGRPRPGEALGGRCERGASFRERVRAHLGEIPGREGDPGAAIQGGKVELVRDGHEPPR